MRKLITPILLLSLCLITGCSKANNHGNIAALTRKEDLETGKIVILSPDGDQITQIESGLYSDGCPNWSPDGQKIAFVSRDSSEITSPERSRNLYIIDSHGKNLIQITDGPGDVYGVDWSPDGTKIVYAASSERMGLPNSLYIMDADGTNPQQIHLETDFLRVSGPNWSPDGQSILFSGSLNMGDRIDYPSTLYVFHFGQTRPEPITVIDPNLCRSDVGGDWSPDGLSIVYSTNDYWCMVHPSRIRRIELNGSGFFEYPDMDPNISNHSPSWSSDGKSILYLSNMDIHRMNADGTNIQQLTTTGNLLCYDVQP